MFGHSEHCNAMRGNPHLENASNIKGIATHLAVLAMTRKTGQLDKMEFVTLTAFVKSGSI